MHTTDAQFDVLVIGGGAAGLMAAYGAAQQGARVALVEKNERYGVKLLMTGNGRCNVTQDAENLVEFARTYTNGRFLLSAFNAFSPQDMREFLLSKGIETKVEKQGRVFPESDQSKDVRDALYEALRQQNVTFFNEEEVVGIEKEGNAIVKVITKRKEITAKNYIIATGGKSYAHTGSSGEGYQWCGALGHTVVTPRPVLVPVKLSEPWLEELQGVSVHNCAVSVLQNAKVIAKETGDIMFAHYGLSGPLILNISRSIEKVLAHESVTLTIDLKPYLSEQQLDAVIRNDFEKNANKNFSNCLQDLFTPNLRDFIIAQSRIDPEKHAANISREERKRIVGLCKYFKVTVESLFGFEKAMTTAGGVSTKEIDSKTMRSKLFENLYFAGEIIDVDGPTGGYNLQMCWSTGFVAGKNAAISLGE